MDKKVLGIEEKQYHTGKTYDELKLKELKHSGDIRELQVTIKEIGLQVNETNKSKSRG